MQYYLFSLTHSKMFENIGVPIPQVRVNGYFRPYTYVTSDPSSYPFSDYKVVTQSDASEKLKIKRG